MKGADFKIARLKLGMTQEQIGAELGDSDSRYSTRAVSSWENAEREVPPAVAKLIKIMVMAKGL